MELGALAPSSRLEEAGPEGALDLELLRREEVLDADAAALEGGAASDELVSGLQGAQGEEHPGEGRLRTEQYGICDRKGGTMQSHL